MAKDNMEKKENNTTVLVFPPQWTPQNPHFAMTQLMGHIRKNGWKVVPKDLNVEFYDEVLTPEYITTVKNRLATAYNYLTTQVKLSLLINDNSLEAEIGAMKILAIDEFMKENADLVERLPGLILDAKETLRDPRRFYNPMLLVDAFYAIDKALEFISLPYHPSMISFNDFDQPHMLMATAHLIQHCEDKKANMFYDFMERKANEILKENPLLVALSINSFTQVLPGLTLAGMLREKAPKGTYISIGGNFFDRVKDALMKRPEFFENFCHCVAMGEGEKQSVTMLEEIHKGNGFENVPDILYYEKNEKGEPSVKYTFPQEPEPLDNIAFQDLEGLPLDLYFTPNLVLCLQSSKGCYWGKCTFCDTDYGIKHDVKSLDRLVGEIKYLKENFGVKDFEFIDESIHPEYMKKMAQRFIDEDLGVHWFSNGRLEKDFNAPLLQLLAKSGLTLILWGFESGNDRILKLINKGIDLGRRYEILKAANDTGIWNFAYIFFGFPTETRDEALDTITAIIDHKDVIDSYGRSVFTLGRHSLLCIDAEKYGVFNIMEDQEELSTNLHYKTKIGMTDAEIDQIMRDCTKMCATAYEYNLWYYLRYRENIHLYLVKYDKEYIRDYKVQQELSTRLATW